MIDDYVTKIGPHFLPFFRLCFNLLRRKAWMVFLHELEVFCIMHAEYEEYAENMNNMQKMKKTSKTLKMTLWRLNGVIGVSEMLK